jgi:shikimate kinase
VRRTWETFGEAAWREAEAAALDEVLQQRGQVVALGGGTPMVVSARQRIQADRAARRARVIYLSCERPELRRRLEQMPGDRPSLTGAALSEELATVLAAREPTYRQIADFTLDVSALAVDQVATQLAARLDRH